MKVYKLIFTFLIIFSSLLVSSQSVIVYDIVLKGGRVIDPETKLDAVRNVGIIQNQIVQISNEDLRGKQVIDATGLVVAPGF
ncbi:MAG TPA: hypothetical protein PLU37_06570, partial [Chitinophagaceae bacterium]|nr:hypothetical protein [Chitinophagaceae bacterium]